MVDRVSDYIHRNAENKLAPAYNGFTFNSVDIYTHTSDKLEDQRSSITASVCGECSNSSSLMYLRDMRRIVWIHFVKNRCPYQIIT